jgi:hypothetical protein
MNLLDTILDQKVAEGEARGRAEGEARGRLEEKRSDVRAVLAARFGAIPPALRSASSAPLWRS